MNISLVPAPQSLLGILATLPDPRRRQGRMYPLASILGLLVLAALNGERSLRGMWMWGCTHWPQIADGLGFWDVARPPTLSTVWYVLTRLDLDALDAVVHEWATPWLQTEPEGWSIDGKVVRGSKRADRAARRVVGGCYPYPWWITQIPLCNAINRDSAEEHRRDAQPFVFLSATSFGLMVHSCTDMPFLACASQKRRIGSRDGRTNVGRSGGDWA